MNTDDTGDRPQRRGAAAGFAFAVEDLTTGPDAHGFGTTDDGRDFAFQVRRAALRLEIYRSGHDTPVPRPDDAVAVAELPVTDVDLDDPRSVTALVRDAVSEARRAERSADHTKPVRALLGKIGSVFDGR